jgi:uridylate kinase
MQRKPVVIKISGNYVQPDNPALIKSYADMLRDLWVNRGIRPFVVVGGGKVARQYIDAARLNGANESFLDVLGIMVTRLNATLLATSIGSIAVLPVPSSIEDIIKLSNDPSERIVVMGGLQPGQSTNAVSAIIAEITGSNIIINASKIDGVYDKDPEKYPDAKLLREVRLSEVKELLKQQLSYAGRYELLDQISLTIAERSKIKIIIVRGDDPSNLEKALNKGFYGSIIYLD